MPRAARFRRSCERLNESMIFCAAAAASATSSVRPPASATRSAFRAASGSLRLISVTASLTSMHADSAAMVGIASARRCGIAPIAPGPLTGRLIPAATPAAEWRAADAASSARLAAAAAATAAAWPRIAGSFNRAPLGWIGARPAAAGGWAPRKMSAADGTREGRGTCCGTPGRPEETRLGGAAFETAVGLLGFGTGTTG